ncbi:hypothetical protein PDQ79_33850 [Bacillus cereus]|nr:hypothetical protein [Bacillus cereus]
MNQLDFIKQIQQNLRVAQGYEKILKHEIAQSNDLIWYEKESLLNQLEQIKHLINQSLTNLDSVEQYTDRHTEVKNTTSYHKTKAENIHVIKKKCGRPKRNMQSYERLL